MHTQKSRTRPALVAFLSIKSGRSRTAAKRTTILIACSAFLFGCQDSPTGVDLTPVAGIPSLDLSDALHGDGPRNEHFFFLPPMVSKPRPRPSGEFLSGLSPVVEIQCLDSAEFPCPDVLPGFPLIFTTQSGPRGERDRIRERRNHYRTHWDTKRFGMPDDDDDDDDDDDRRKRKRKSHEDREEHGPVFRITVRVGEVVLGFADVQLVESVRGRGRRFRRRVRHDDEGLILLEEDRKLKIRFRIEQGALAAEDDTTVPVLTGVSVDPQQVETSGSSQAVQVTLFATDDLSGVAYTGNGCSGFVSGVVFTSPSGAQTVKINSCSFELLSGSELDGSFSAVATFPQSAEQGVWRLTTVLLKDQAGNLSSLDADDLDGLGISASVEVTSPGDITPPVLTGVSVDPQQVETSGSSQAVQVTLFATDDLSGVAYTGNGCSGFVSGVVFTSPSGAQTVKINSCSFELLSGSELDGSFSAVATFPQSAEQGVWRLTTVLLEDQAGNLSSLDADDLDALGISASVVVGALVLQPSELCSAHTDAAIATFEDANLEAAVRAALGVGAQEDLTCGLISGLTSLFASSAGITSLVGIQNLTRLEFLVLNQNSISDISPLGGLTSLTHLLLGLNSITDINALSGLAGLTNLSLIGNSLSNIGALSGLTSLTNLGLSNNSISDISALRMLTSLTDLSLNLNAITDISVDRLNELSGLRNLTNLNLSENPGLGDIEGLRELKSLTVLSLSGASLSNIEPLSGLTNLAVLQLFNSSIVDISALSGLTNLTNLFLRNNTNLMNIQPLLDNTGLGLGDVVDLKLTAVSCDDINALELNEVTVTSDCQ